MSEAAGVRVGARVSGAGAGFAGGTSVGSCEVAGGRAGCWAAEAEEVSEIFVAKSCSLEHLGRGRENCRGRDDRGRLL